MPSTRSVPSYVAHVLSVLADAHNIGPGWVAACPLHDDRTRSLRVLETDGRVVVRCTASCRAGAVASAIEVLMAASRPGPRPAHAAEPREPGTPLGAPASPAIADALAASARLVHAA